MIEDEIDTPDYRVIKRKMTPSPSMEMGPADKLLRPNEGSSPTLKPVPKHTIIDVLMGGNNSTRRERINSVLVVRKGQEERKIQTPKQKSRKETIQCLPRVVVNS